MGLRRARRTAHNQREVDRGKAPISQQIRQGLQLETGDQNTVLHRDDVSLRSLPVARQLTGPPRWATFSR
jgi:hypothetical protein